MPDLDLLLSGLVFPESPRWHDGRLWLADWGAEEVIAIDTEGKSEVVAKVASFPFSIDWLPDGRLLAVSARARRLLRREPDGRFVDHAELSDVASWPWNEIVVDGRGNIYMNNIGFDFPGGDFAPGMVALVSPDAMVRQVADAVAFPNGMAVTPDNSTLIVAESYANRLTAFDIAADGTLSNRRVWAALGDGVPDGICLDAEGAVWYVGAGPVRTGRGGPGSRPWGRLAIGEGDSPASEDVTAIGPPAPVRLRGECGPRTSASPTLPRSPPERRARCGRRRVPPRRPHRTRPGNLSNP